MNTTTDSGEAGITAVRTKILAYLGQLRPEEYAPARKLCYHLNLRFSTAKNTLTMLEERGLVEKIISNDKGVVALFRIDPHANMKGIPFVPPEWSDAYGKHPHTV